jgi:uncharacterized protein (UPF0218 family)
MRTASTPLGLDELSKHDLVLPDKLIPELRRPLGELLLGELPKVDPSGLGKIVCVGDQCTLTLLKQGIKPSLVIVDHKTKRQRIEVGNEFNGFELVLELRNPQGMISRDSWEVLKSALNARKHVRIDVEGEEDLLALPSIMLAPLGTSVLYGMPSQGLVIVKVDESIKQKVLDILNRMVKSHGN